MKKAILLPTVFLFGTVYAQSNLQISGELDGGIRLTKTADGKNINSMKSGGGKLIFKGSEDLGSGTKANFLLEMSPNIENGSLSRFGTFNRGSWIGLSNKDFGEIRLGRFLTGTANFVCQVDLHWCWSGFNNTGIMYNGDIYTVGRWISGSPGRGGNNNAGISTYSGGNQTAGSAESNRKNNAIQYTSPRINGFQGKLTFAQGENTEGIGKGRHIDATLTYSKNNYFIGITHASVDKDPLWDATGKLTSIGGTYKFNKKFKAGLIYQFEKANGKSALWTKASSWALTTSYEIDDKKEFYFKTGQHKTNGVGAYRIVNGIDTFVLNAGGIYKFSKRTSAYIDYVTDLKGSDGVKTTYTRNPQVLTVGLQHIF